MTKRQARHLKAEFLTRFRVHGNISAACREIGMTNRTEVYRWQEHDDEFAAEFQQAEIEATETMEREAYRRAVEGTEEPIYHQGDQVGSVRKYSDTLLIFMLKARNPSKYRERVQMQHADADGKRLPLGAVEEFVKDALGSRT